MAVPPPVIRGIGSGLLHHILQLISCGEMRDANMFVVGVCGARTKIYDCRLGPS